MIFRRRRKDDEIPAAEAEDTPRPTWTRTPATPPTTPRSSADEAAETDELDVDALDSRDWRGAGPWDLTEVDLDVEPLPGGPGSTWAA